MNKNKLKTIESLIRDKSEAQLKGLIVELCDEFPDSYEHLLLWGKKGGSDVNEKLALEYWEKAEGIIDEFNEYGGGSDYEESEAYGYIESLCELHSKLSWEVRRKILDGMLTQYHYGNSGFDDALTDACFEMCKKHEEWLYLADKLLGYGRDWDKKLVMDIYKRIGDDDGFLTLRRSNLRYGSDYFELVEYYSSKKDMESALSYAHIGLENGDGRVDHITAFLFDYYEKMDDAESLEKIAQICETANKERAFVCGRLYEYYKARNDYDNAKKYLLKEFEYIRSSDLDKQYKKVKAFLNDDDWRTVEGILFRDMKKRDIEGYLRVCLDKGLKQEVYDTIAEKFSPWGTDYAFFADMLKRDFPEKIIEYYFKFALYYVENGSNRKSYIQSMKYFKKAKEIYIKILEDAPRWERKLAEIKERYKKRKAFLEEARVLD